MVKSVDRTIAGPDAVAAGDSGPVPAAGGDAAGAGQGPGPGGPAARVPLRQLMDDRLPARWPSGPATRPAGCG